MKTFRLKLDKNTVNSNCSSIFKMVILIKCVADCAQFTRSTVCCKLWKKWKRRKENEMKISHPRVLVFRQSMTSSTFWLSACVGEKLLHSYFVDKRSAILLNDLLVRIGYLILKSYLRTYIVAHEERKIIVAMIHVNVFFSVFRRNFFLLSISWQLSIRLTS